jgi:hypothetical protein
MATTCTKCGSPDGCEDCGLCWNCGPPCPEPREEGITVDTFDLGDLSNAPVISTHGYPQVSPQEWDCGCVAGAYVTDRDALAGEEPFEMRLARGCETPRCCLVSAATQ